MRRGGLTRDQLQSTVALQAISCVIEAKLAGELGDPYRALRALDRALLHLCTVESMLLRSLPADEIATVRLAS